MTEEHSVAVEDIGAKPAKSSVGPQVPEHVPRIHTPHETLSPRAARLLDLAAYEMSREEPPASDAEGFIKKYG